MPRGTFGLRTVMPVAAALAAAGGALVAYLIIGQWPYAIAGAGVGAWAASLLAAEGMAIAIGRAAARLRAIAGDGSAEAAQPSTVADFMELDGLIDEVGRAMGRRDDAASQDRARLVAALNSSGDAIVAVDGEGKVCFANIAAERLLFRSALEGRPFAWLLPNAAVIEAMRLSAETARRQVCTIERPNQRFLEVSVNPVVGGDWSAFLVFHDVTEVRRADQMRRDFVANVSHELRTPLASIRAVLDTLESGAMSDAVAGAEFIARAQTEVERLTQMVAELLELSRLESGETKPHLASLDLSGVAAAAVERMRPQAERLGVALGLDAAPGTAVMGDAQRLERAIVNLVHNALKFTPPGGHVAVTVSGEGDFAAVEVKDDGAGIDARDLARIFERFYKSDRSRGTEGSGLGLALVKHTAETHGGSISVDSEPGRGSAFVLRLPSQDSAPQAPESGLAAKGSRR